MMTSLRKIYYFLDKLYEIIYRIWKWEGITRYFVVFKGEDIKEFRPNFDYEGTQKEIKEINRYRLYLKSLVGKTKAQYIIEEEGMTIDELEMYKEDLQHRISALNEIIEIKPSREDFGNGIFMETCCNYDEEKIRKEIEETKNDLDRINKTLKSVYDSAIVSINKSESQWEQIIEEKNTYIENIIDKKLWNKYDSIRRDRYYSNNYISYMYTEEDYVSWINPDWWDSIFWY